MAMVRLVRNTPRELASPAITPATTLPCVPPPDSGASHVVPVSPAFCTAWTLRCEEPRRCSGSVGPDRDWANCTES